MDNSQNSKLKLRCFVLETASENQMVKDLIEKHNLNSIWTSGRLCNFKGCSAPHLQPRKINGEYQLTLGIYSIPQLDNTGCFTIV